MVTAFKKISKKQGKGHLLDSLEKMGSHSELMSDESYPLLLQKNGLTPRMSKEFIIRMKLKDDVIWRELRECLKTMKILEEECPGSVSVLHDDFNMTFFGRYPIEVLKKQYLERNDKSLAYGISVFAKIDHNGILQSSQETLKKMSAALQEKSISMRIIESGNRFELTKQLILLNRRYGGNDNKIKFILLEAHASKNRVTLGAIELEEDFIAETINSSDLKLHIVQQLRSFFDEKVHIFFFACDTGEKKGIAQGLSDKWKCITIGPADQKPSTQYSLEEKFEKLFEVKTPVLNRNTSPDALLSILPIILEHRDMQIYGVEYTTPSNEIKESTTEVSQKIP